MDNIFVDFSKQRGKIKPLHGINNGPITNYGFMDTSDEYRAAGIPFVRLHDCNSPRPDRVDIPQVFPDFDADPGDPDSYHFALTDGVIASVFACGASPIYRLGTSIEHEKEKKYVFPPKDNQKWAEICAGIIRHYTQGWANGYHYPISYWEIWNEPDLTPEMWVGTPEQYFDLYTTAAPLLKEWFPEIKIGGCAICSVWNHDFINGFLSQVVKTGAPLDFFSWHWYGDSPEQMKETVLQVNKLLAGYGLTEAESICDEWNYMRGTMWVPARREKYIRREFYEKQKNHFGASFVAGCMAVMQENGVDVSTYYDGQPNLTFCGIFDRYGIETKTYRVFEAFHKLYRLGNAVPVQTPEGFYGLAAFNGKQAAVLISNFSAPGQNYELKAAGLPAGMVRLSIQDEHRMMEPFAETAFTGEFSVRPVLLTNSVLLAQFDLQQTT